MSWLCSQLSRHIEVGAENQLRGDSFETILMAVWVLGHHFMPLSADSTSKLIGSSDVSPFVPPPYRCISPSPFRPLIL